MVKNLPGATRRALADRAVFLAEAVEFRMKELEKEIEEQNPAYKDLPSRQQWHALVSLRASVVWEAMKDLCDRAKEIRKFARARLNGGRPARIGIGGAERATAGYGAASKLNRGLSSGQRYAR